MADERVNPETNAPERECEECLKWLGLYEFPTKGRSWICKVCQGLKPPPKSKVNGNVGYAEYLLALKTIDEELAAYKEESRMKIAEFKERRRALVASQYAKYEKS